MHGEFISYQTLIDIAHISFPETQRKMLNVYYLADNVRLGIDCDDDLKFQWKNIAPDVGGVTHYYFDVLSQSSLVLHIN